MRTSWKYHWYGNDLLDNMFKEHIHNFEYHFPELISYSPPTKIKSNKAGFPIYYYKGNEYIYETEKMKLPKKKYRSMHNFLQDMLNDIDRKIIKNWEEGHYDKFFDEKFCHISPYSLASKNNTRHGSFNDDDDFNVNI